VEINWIYISHSKFLIKTWYFHYFTLHS